MRARWCYRVMPLLVAVATVLSGCVDYGPKTNGGALIGAGLGGLAGSQIGHGSGKLAATGAGVLLGGLLGGSAGQSLDRADSVYYSRSYAPPQQVPRPQPYAPPQPYYPAPTYYVPPAAAYGAQTSAGGCQQLGPGPRGEPTVACQAPNGAWYITQ